MYWIWRSKAFLTYYNESSLLNSEPIPWFIIIYCMKGASWAWYCMKCCYVIPIFIMIYCWRLIPISWIWVIPWAIILKYWSRFWLRFVLSYLLLSFLKFFENLKIYFLDASSEKAKIALMSSKVGFDILILCLSFWISASRSNSETASCCSWVSDYYSFL